MVDIPDNIEEYGFQLEKTPKDVEKTVLNNLNILKAQALKLMETYERYCETEDVSLQEDLTESMSSRLNHIVQAFKDIVAYIEIYEKGCVNESSGFLSNQGEAEKLITEQYQQKVAESICSGVMEALKK